MITWNEKKRQTVIKEHGVDFARIENAFDDPYVMQFYDREHSEFEERWNLIAKTVRYGLIFLVYTFRGEDIHYVTARRAEKWMANLYEEQRSRF